MSCGDVIKKHKKNSYFCGVQNNRLSSLKNPLDCWVKKFVKYDAAKSKSQVEANWGPHPTDYVRFKSDFFHIFLLAFKTIQINQISHWIDEAVSKTTCYWISN